jgi:phospholipase/lecithinase/hemolysin
MQAGLPMGAKYVDTFNLMHDIFSNPGAFGFTNVTDPCFNGSSVCSDPNDYLFWDGFHPTTAADAILAEQFATAATPEPSAILLMGTGVLGLMFLVRRATA